MSEYMNRLRFHCQNLRLVEVEEVLLKRKKFGTLHPNEKKDYTNHMKTLVVHTTSIINM